MAKILIADGKDLKITIEWSALDQILTDKLTALGHAVTLENFGHEELKKQICNFEIIVVGDTTVIDKEIIDAATNLKMIIKAGIWLQNIDVAYAEAKGIIVKNTPECSRNAISELIIGHIISISRFFFQTFISMKNNEWKHDSYTGIEMKNRTLGLVGLDDTAKMVAKKAQALGVTVRYWDEKGKDEKSELEYVAFDELLANSTYLSLHVPYNESKGSIMNKEQLFKMEKGANIINCYDGRLINEDALLEALGASMSELHLFGACLDVFAQEPTTNKKLMAHDRVSVTPHICHETYEANTQRIDEIVDLIQRG
ncbi:MAG: NAD(P)-dependent oxidoreductase [Clostridia bacterium]